MDSSLVPANVRRADLVPTELRPEDLVGPGSRAEEVDGVLTVRRSARSNQVLHPPCRMGPPPGPPAVTPARPLASFVARRYQDRRGQLPLSRVDPDVRWRTQGAAHRAVFSDKENVIVDRSGFSLARGLTPADASDLLGALPLLPGCLSC